MIPEAEEFAVLEWIRGRTLSKDWLTLRDVKE
jgi:hypothetical protein